MCGVMRREDTAQEQIDRGPLSAVSFPFRSFPALLGRAAHPLTSFAAWRLSPKSRKEGKGNVGPSLTGG